MKFSNYLGERERERVQVNPDEVVAMGAAVQAGVLAGEVKDEDGESVMHCIFF